MSVRFFTHKHRLLWTVVVDDVVVVIVGDVVSVAAALKFLANIP